MNSDGDQYSPSGQYLPREQTSDAILKVFDVLSTGRKMVGNTIVRSADAIYLGSAFRASTKYGRRGASHGYKVMRNQFFRQYGGRDIMDEKLSDSDEFEPTEDELLERVDARYFEKDFDAMKAEVSFLSSIHATSEAEYVCHLEVEEIRRKKQHNFISGSLKFRVLANYNDFVEAIHQVGQIKDDLKKTSNMCSSAKEHMRKCKDSVAIRGLMIPKLYRRKQRIKSVIEIVDVVRDLHQRYESVMNYLETGRFCNAIDIINEFEQHDEERFRTLRQVESMKVLLIKCHFIMTDPLAIQSYVYAAIDQCLVDFSTERYSNMMEGVRRRVDIRKVDTSGKQDPQESNLLEITFVKLRDGLVDKVHTEIIRTITGVSNVKKEELGIVAISKAIEPGLLLSCICKLCGRLLDFMWLYSQIIKCHIDLSKSDEEGSSAHRFHRYAVDFLNSVVREINLGTKIGLILDNAPKGNLDIDTVLHIFFVATTLVDVSTVLENSPNGQTTLKQAVLCFLQDHFVLPQMVDIVRIMVEDSFVMEHELKMRLLDMPVVVPMNPQVYLSCIEDIKRYFDEVVPLEHRNPYYTPKFLEVQDTSKYLEMDMYRNTPQCIPNRSCAILSSERLCNAIFQCVARVIARLPPLASESLTLSENMISAYIYVAASNLIGLARDVPLEMSPGYTARTRKSLTRMREKALEIIPFANERDKSHVIFPPPIFSDSVFKNIYSKASAFYGLSNRITGIEAMFGVVSRYSVSVEAVAPFMYASVVNEHRSLVQELMVTVSELLEVCMHSLCTTIVPNLDILIKEIKNTNLSKGSNSFINNFMKTFQTFKKSVTSELDLFPTHYSTEVFWCRCYYVIQSTIIEAISTKKISSEEDFYVLSNAVSTLLSRLKEVIPSEKIRVFDKYAIVFLNTFLHPFEGRMLWLESTHDHYSAADMIAWLGGLGQDNKGNRRSVEACLEALQHEDSIAFTFDAESS